MQVYLLFVGCDVRIAHNDMVSATAGSPVRICVAGSSYGD